MQNNINDLLRPLRRQPQPLFLLTLLYTTLTFVTLTVLFYRNGDMTTDDIISLYVQSWTLAPIAGFVLSAVTIGWLQIESNTTVQKLSLWHSVWLLFVVVVLRNMTVKDQLVPLGMMLLIVTWATHILFVILGKVRWRYWQPTFFIMALVLSTSILTWLVQTPFVKTSTFDNGATMTIHAESRYLYPCTTLTWAASDTIEQVVLLNVEPLPREGEREFCYHNPLIDVDYVIFDVLLDDGRNIWNEVQLSGLTHDNSLSVALVTVVFLLIPAWVVRSHRYEAVFGVWVAVVLAFWWVPQTEKFIKILAVSAILLGVLGILHRWLFDRIPSINVPRGVDVLALLVLPLFVVNLSFPYDRWHHNFILGPVNDILHGKTLLIDALTQYGVGLSYSLAAVFAGFPVLLSYVGFSFVLSLLLVVTLTLLYLTLRMMRVPTVVVLVVMMALVITQVIRPLFSELTNPTLGSLRYIWQYVLAFLLAYRVRFDKPRVQWVEAFVMSWALFWSFDGLAMVWPAYFGVMVYEGISRTSSWRMLLGRLSAILIGTVLLYVAYGLWAFLQHGQWPDWEIYYSVVLFYAFGGWNFIPTYSLWVFPSAVYMVSFLLVMMKLFFAHDRNQLRAYLPVVMLTASGILQLFYWVRVSGTANFYPFVLIPIVLTGYWFTQAQQHITSAAFRRAMTYSTAFGFIMLIVANVILPSPTHLKSITPFDVLVQAIREGQAPDFRVDVLRNPPASYEDYLKLSTGVLDENVADAVAIVQQYAPNDDRVVLFVRSETATETLLRLGKGEAFVVSHPNMVTFNEPFTAWALQHPSPVGAGDVIFAHQDRGQLEPFQQEWLGRLEEVYTFDVLDISMGGIQAIRLR